MLDDEDMEAGGWAHISCSRPGFSLSFSRIFSPFLLPPVFAAHFCWSARRPVHPAFSPPSFSFPCMFSPVSPPVFPVLLHPRPPPTRGPQAWRHCRCPSCAGLCCACALRNFFLKLQVPATAARLPPGIGCRHGRRCEPGLASLPWQDIKTPLTISQNLRPCPLPMGRRHGQQHGSHRPHGSCNITYSCHF